MNNPFAYRPDAECDRAFGELLARIDVMRGSERAEEVNFCRELEEGKMLGVLIAEDSIGARHTLYAFSGQLGQGGFDFAEFVGPVFDYLRPGGYFKTHEALISRLNEEIAAFESQTLAGVEEEYRVLATKCETELAAFKKKCRVSKAARDLRRQSGRLAESEVAEMIRQSQHEKAELRRLKKRLDAEMQPMALRLKQARGQLGVLKEKRRRDSENLQQWLFSNFKVLNARGQSKSLREIFAETAIGVPPSGAGECCAPKLLQAAYLWGLRPVSIAEYWYGKPKDGEVRIHGQHYPACRGKCLPVLSWMLQGLDITPPLESIECRVVVPELKIFFQNEWFCVVDKPSGMLSVPGKGRAPSVQSWLQEKFGSDCHVKVAHRLDQDTSGLLIATFDDKAYKEIQALFAQRKIAKTYIADLDGDYRASGLPGSGRIELPLAPDWLDRPRQRVDGENGKQAITDYEFVDVTEGRSRVIFHPHTGRTHQLRVHAASSQGLGMPIVGDRLYGRDTDATARASLRLLLHAQQISFTFPLDGQSYTFVSPVPF